MEYLARIATTLWIGSLWAIGFIAAPVVFSTLPDRVEAGLVAGRLFTVTAWVGIVCGAFLLLFHLARAGARPLRDRAFWALLLLFVLTLAAHFGVDPVLARLKAMALPREVMQSAFRSRFATWHGIASIVYVIQALLGLALVLKGGGAAAGKSAQGKTSRGLAAGR